MPIPNGFTQNHIKKTACARVWAGRRIQLDSRLGSANFIIGYELDEWRIGDRFPVRMDS